MSRQSTLMKNTAIILFGKLCTQLISYLLLPLYTTVLSTEEYGTVDLLTTYVTLIAPVVTLQMEAAVFRFLIDVRGDKVAVSRIITSSLACLLGTLGIFLAAYGVLNCFIAYTYALPFAACVIANALLAVVLQMSRGLGDNVTYAAGSAVSGILTIVFNILLIVVFPLGVTGMLWATALAQLTGAAFVAIKIRVFRYIDKKQIDKAVIREMSRYSLPLLPNSLSWWIISVSDRTLVTFFIGVDANGILAVATKLAAIVVNVFGIFNLSWTESVAVHIRDRDGAAYISEVTNQSFRLFGSCGLVLIMGCAVFFRYFVGADFQSAYDLIPLLVIGSVLNVLQSLYGIIYIGLKDTRRVSRSSAVAAAINLVIDLLLIKGIGLYAAPISTICAMLFLSIYRYMDVNRKLSIRMSAKQLAVLLAGYAVTYAIYLQRKTAMSCIWLAATVAFCAVWNRAMLRDGVQLVKGKLRSKNAQKQK